MPICERLHEAPVQDALRAWQRCARDLCNLLNPGGLDMMLCDADFEELFPDLFGPEKPNRSTWHPGRPGQSAREGEGMTSNWGPNHQAAPVRATQIVADNSTSSAATCRMIK